MPKMAPTTSSNSTSKPVSNPTSTPTPTSNSTSNSNPTPNPQTPKTLRKALKLTQSQAADRCGVSLRSWKVYEAAGEFPSAKREFIEHKLKPTRAELDRIEVETNPEIAARVAAHGDNPLLKIPFKPEAERYRGVWIDSHTGEHRRFIEGEWRVVDPAKYRREIPRERQEQIMNQARAALGWAPEPLERALAQPGIDSKFMGS